MALKTVSTTKVPTGLEFSTAFELSIKPKCLSQSLIHSDGYRRVSPPVQSLPKQVQSSITQAKQKLSMTSQSILPLLIHCCDSNNRVNIYKSSRGDKDPYYVGKFQWRRATTQRAASSFPGPKMIQEEVGQKDFLEAFTGRWESLVLWAARQRKKESILLLG